MKNKLFAQVLQAMTKYFIVLVLIVMVGIAASGIRVVDSGNVALILRFGKLVGDTPEEQIHEPGLLFAFPYIIDEVVMVPTGSIMEQSVTTYYTPDDTRTVDGSYVITGDQSIAVLAASVKYVISDPVAYALYVGDVGAVINASVSNALLTRAAASDVDVLLTSGKDAFAADSLRYANEKLAEINVGVTINTLEMTTVSMAQEVRKTYDEVNSATVNAETVLENARVYRDKLIPQAEANSAARVTAANNQFSIATASAKVALSEFWGVLEEFERTPDVVKLRILNTKTAAILDKIGTIRIVQDGESTILLIPKEGGNGES